MECAFDDHADFRLDSDDGERIAFRFAAIGHRLMEENLWKTHVVVVMAVGYEKIIQIAGGDAPFQHIDGGAEARVNQNVVIDKSARAVLIRFIFRKGAAGAEKSDGNHAVAPCFMSWTNKTAKIKVKTNTITVCFAKVKGPF